MTPREPNPIDEDDMVYLDAMFTTSMLAYVGFVVALIIVVMIFT